VVVWTFHELSGKKSIGRSFDRADVTDKPYGDGAACTTDRGSLGTELVEMAGAV